MAICHERCCAHGRMSGILAMQDKRAFKEGSHKYKEVRRKLSASIIKNL